MRARAAALALVICFGADPLAAQTLADLAAQARAAVQAASPQPAPQAAAPAILAPNEVRIPVPAETIGAGDIISNDMLEDRTIPTAALNRYPAAVSRAALVGKMARRMLVAGHPVPANAVAEPKLVTRGVPAQIRFEESGLAIRAIGLPLESGIAGAVIRLKNIDSNQIVTGTVQSDGSVKVGG
ncbi:flagellar basal body P-ring formation chaperone FlgA [Aquabacter spiritensis]|uniref:Flagella basal body P-ring formation protein FlgA n=1 Tax=Aquabacter spiritensis TaxID=933073 RepID=A0A4R3M3Y4_9HYPH|nr:flagellar basal body P-ring formation chaperone FlgA [Aquabacter spiritensis]TCT07930.1 flagella basal body P-ring formation protein FlgA [Aquabacter spiritensis]